MAKPLKAASRKTPVATAMAKTAPKTSDVEVSTTVVRGNDKKNFAHITIAVLSFLAGIVAPQLLGCWISNDGHNKIIKMVRETKEQRQLQHRESESLLNSEQSSSSSLHSNNDRSEDQSSLPALHTACNEANLARFLHASPVPGMHLLCFSLRQIHDDDTVNDHDNDTTTAAHTLDIIFYLESHSPALESVSLPFTGPAKNSNRRWNTIRSQLTQTFFRPSSTRAHESFEPKQSWALFTPRGDRIIGEDDDHGDNCDFAVEAILASEMVLVMEGGVWMWPGVREGFRRRIDLWYSSVDTNRTVVLHTLSLKPLVLSLEGFLTQDECAHIRERASPKLRYSDVSRMDHDEGRPASDWRTSQSAFLPNRRRDSVLSTLERRTASLTRIPIPHQEDIQVLRYDQSEKYDAHHDYFDPNMYQKDESTLNLIQNGTKNRFATVFWYLSDVTKGGHTIFPRHDNGPPPNDYSNCQIGLKVTPKRGNVIIFYSLTARGDLDPLSLHGACPVEEGIKWAANKWIWNAPMNFISNH